MPDRQPTDDKNDDVRTFDGLDFLAMAFCCVRNWGARIRIALLLPDNPTPASRGHGYTHARD